jgi:IclR family KDG regulon transcriptional repressor
VQEKTTSTRSDYSSSLERGIRILSEFVNTPRMTVSELARRTSVSRSTASRLAAALAEKGFLARDPNSLEYGLGLRLWELGSLVPQRLDYMDLARQAMDFLSDATGETIHLSTLDGRDVIYLGKVDGTHAIVAYTRIGGRAPAYAVASGRALLAAHPPELVANLYPEILVGYTPRTITQRDDLLDALARERAMGYSVNVGEYREDVGGVAAAITSPDGPIAALGVTCPTSRLSPEQRHEYARLVREAALIARGEYRPQFRN